jgi:hypothetical protein
MARWTSRRLRHHPIPPPPRRHRLVRQRDKELERVRRKYADEIKTVEGQLAALAPF